MKMKKNKKLKVMLVSYINSSNIGDQLIVEGLKSMLPKNSEIIEYDYAARKKNKKKVEIGKIIEKKNNLKDFYIKHFRQMYIFDIIHDLINRLRFKFSKKWKEYEKDLKECDFVLTGGGNLIFDLSPRSSAGFYFNEHTKRFKKYNKKVLVSSIGIGPFFNSRQIKIANKALEKCDFVTFRDPKSLEFMKEDLVDKKYFQSVDSVFFLEKSVDKVDNKVRIGICIMDLRLIKVSEEVYKDYLLGLKKIVNKLEEKYEVIIFSSEKNDYKTIQDMINLDYLRNSQVEVISNSKELLDLYKKLNIVIGTRMHSMIVAISQYIPVIGLSWQEKVNQMFELIDDRKSNYSIFEINDKIEDVLNDVELKLNNLEKEKIKLMEQKKNLCSKYEINYKILEKIMKFGE